MILLSFFLFSINCWMKLVKDEEETVLVTPTQDHSDILWLRDSNKAAMEDYMDARMSLEASTNATDIVFYNAMKNALLMEVKSCLE